MAKTTKRASNLLSNLGITVYPGYALVQGTYPVRLVDGRNSFEVEGLPTNYDPLSLYFDSFDGPGRITLGPVSYRAANLSQAALLAASIDSLVTVRHGSNNPAEQRETRGKLKGVSGNTVFLLKDGKLEQIPNVVGYVFNGVPAGVSNTPALSVSVEATAAGDYVATLLYKALGFSWSADYKWIFNEAAGVVDWDGSVFVSNGSGASYPDAQIKVVAGDAGAEPEQFSGRRSRGAQPMMAAMSLESAGGGRDVHQADTESLGQVKVYTIPTRGDVEQGEAQKIPFFTAAGVPVKLEFRVRAFNGWHAYNNRQEAQVARILIFKNDKDNKLGTPLPGGSVSIMQRDKSGTLLKSGGGRIQDVALGEEVKFESGVDGDLKVVRTVLDKQVREELLPLPEGSEPSDPSLEGGALSAGPSISRMPRTQAQPQGQGGQQPPRRKKRIYTTRQCGVSLFNGKDRPVEFIVEEALSDNCKFEGDHGFTQVAAGQHEQKVTVAAGEKRVLNFTIVQTDEVFAD